VVVGGQAFGELLVGDGQLDAVAERPQLGFGELLELVGGVAPLELLAEVQPLRVWARMTVGISFCSTASL